MREGRATWDERHWALLLHNADEKSRALHLQADAERGESYPENVDNKSSPDQASGGSAEMMLKSIGSEYQVEAALCAGR